MLPSPAELTYFVEVANTLNISRASERLGISQPTLSLAIKRLEHSFGVPLLIRSKTGVKLTQSGQKLLQHARTLISDWENLRGDALKTETEIRGHYTIGCHPSVAVYSLPSILPRLLKENPLLEIRLVHDLSRKITEEVISFKVDFGIVVNPTEHPDLVIKLLCKDEVGFWVSGSRECDRTVLVCDPELMQTQALLKLTSKREAKFTRTITSSNLEVVTAIVASGAGVGIIPGRVASRLKSLGLTPFEKDGHRVQDRVCLIYRADAQRSFSGKTIARTIEKYFDSNEGKS